MPRRDGCSALPQGHISEGVDLISTGYPSFGRGTYVVAVLMLASVCSFLDRGILSLLVTQLHRDLALSDSQIGILQGVAFGLFYTTLAVPIGWLIDRTHRPRIIAGGILFWSVMTILSGVARNFNELLLARMGVGAGEACLLPAGFSLIADHFPARQRGRALGIFMAAGSAGAGIAMLLGGVLLRAFKEAERVQLPLFGTVFDWQAAFILVGTPGIAIALLVLATLRETPRHGLLHSVTANGRHRPVAVSLSRYMRNNLPLFINVYGLFCCVSFVAFAVIPWSATVFIRRFSATPSEAALWIGPASILGGALGCLVGGMLGDWWTASDARGGKLRCAMVWWLLAAPVILALLLTGSRAGFSVAYALFSFFGYIPYAAAPAILQEIVPGQLRGQATALWYATVGLIGIAVSPIVVPLLEEHVFHDRLALMPAIAMTTLPAVALGFFLTWRTLDVFDRTRHSVTAARIAGEKRNSQDLL